MVTMSFPGLNIPEFSVNPVAFTIPLFGGLEVRWYGIIITLGIIIAFSYCAWRAGQAGIKFDHVVDVAFFTVIFGIMGARAYYVLTSLDKYDSFLDMIAIWNGGLAIYGGIIAGALTIFIVCKIKRLNWLKFFDSVAPGVMIAQSLGRWGNFFNGEAHGDIVSKDSILYTFRMGLSTHNIKGAGAMAEVHPTFLYESVWNLLGFILINIFFKKKKFDGQIVCTYIAWYGFGRMFIEGLRTDSLYVGVFRISQVVGFVCFVVCTILLILGFTKAHRAALTAKSYEPAYPQFATTASMSEASELTEEQVEDFEDEKGSEEDADDGDGDAVVLETIDEPPAQSYNDITAKLDKLFNIPSNSEENKDN